MTELRGARIVLRPLRPEDAADLRRIHAEPSVARWWELPDDDFPLGDEPTATRFAVWVAGEIAGMAQFTEEPDPRARHAEIDLFLATAHQGRGLGREVLAVLVDHLVSARGHHRVVIGADPGNQAALRCYAAAGFRVIGLAEACYRWGDGVWRDEVWMERVVRPGALGGGS